MPGQMVAEDRSQQLTTAVRGCFVDFSLIPSHALSSVDRGFLVWRLALDFDCGLRREVSSESGSLLSFYILLDGLLIWFKVNRIGSDVSSVNRVNRVYDTYRLVWILSDAIL